ncbi:esterase YqiA [Vibrio sp. 99-70-13A1]|uniref:esterase YqiA n=1 Tax=Vibrio sp. 99-70-13A1 TaxID=2607601 RepID=UPI001493511D|nr:esterase YqiA [Vibrio sp. 99-70-13A1]NOH99102.1 esterase YqiA [Vibrio sp. 99-70-13A1]
MSVSSVHKKPSLLLYIHGFNSSSLSHKANVMRDYCATHRADVKILTPQLPSFPQQAALYLQGLVEQYKNDYQIALVGSSLGGYLSTWLNAHYGFKAVVVNPAVKPYELLADYLGEQENPYTHEKYLLEPKHIDELKALEVKTLNDVSDFWLLQQVEDEVLDYRQAVDKYQGSKQTVEQGGDHSFVNFERYPEQILAFLNI